VGDSCGEELLGFDEFADEEFRGGVLGGGRDGEQGQGEAEVSSHGMWCPVGGAEGNFRVNLAENAGSRQVFR
jgi:hypothetical protein